MEGTVTEMDDPSQEYKSSVGATLNVKALKNHSVKFFGLFLGIWPSNHSCWHAYFKKKVADATKLVANPDKFRPVFYQLLYSPTTQGAAKRNFVVSAWKQWSQMS